MTRKDYVAIAGALREARSCAENVLEDDAATGVDVAITLVADVLQEDNPRFDRNRFLDAANHGGLNA